MTRVGAGAGEQIDLWTSFEPIIRNHPQRIRNRAGPSQRFIRKSAKSAFIERRRC
jgi:hypothetical protein